MVGYSNEYKTKIFYQIWRFFFGLFKYSFLLGVFVLPLLFIMMILLELNIVWPFTILSIIPIFNPEFGNGHFTGNGMTTVQLFYPLIFVFALVFMGINWIIKAVTGKKITITLKQKFCILISIITFIYITALILMVQHGSDFYFIIGFFYLFSFFSTVAYVALEFFLRAMDTMVHKKLNETSPIRQTTSAV